MSASRKASADSNNSDDFVHVVEQDEKQLRLEIEKLKEENEKLKEENEKLKEENEKLKKAMEEAKASQEVRYTQAEEFKKMQDVETNKLNEEISTLQQHEIELKNEIVNIKNKESENVQENQRVQQEIKELHENLLKEKEKFAKLEKESSTNIDSIINRFNSQKRNQAGLIVSRAYYSYKTKRLYDELSLRFFENRKNIATEKVAFRNEQKSLNDELCKLVNQANPKESIKNRGERLARSMFLLQQQSDSFARYTEKLKQLHQVLVDLLSQARLLIGVRPKKWVKFNQAIDETKNTLTNLLIDNKKQTENYFQQNHLTIFGGSKLSKHAAFLKAFAAQDFKTAEEIIKQGSVHVDVLRPDGLTQLFYEIMANSNGSNAKWLLAHGASPHQKTLKSFKDNEGRVYCAGSTLIHALVTKWLVSSSGPKATLDHLIEMKIDVNQKDSRGNTPLHIAASLDYYVDTTEVLKRRGGKMDVTNDEGKTPQQVLDARSRSYSKKL